MLEAHDLCGHGPFEIQKLWAPGPPDTKPWLGCTRDEGHNTLFDAYAQKFYHAAIALAEHPEAQYDEAMQYSICREFGVFLDQCTDDELSHLFNLANEFMGV